MARIVKVKHVVTIAGKKYSAKLADIYQNFGASIGVVKAPTPDNTNYDGRITADDYRSGDVIKLKARGTTGTGATAKSREFSITVPSEKLVSALGSIGSKTVTVEQQTYDLNDPRIPRRRTFS